ncbi:MAG: hypothetical protein ABSH17_03700 [Syntrophobacteraceae bacterium]
MVITLDRLDDIRSYTKHSRIYEKIDSGGLTLTIEACKRLARKALKDFPVVIREGASVSDAAQAEEIIDGIGSGLMPLT